MSDEDIIYIDTSALAKWYLNEEGSEEFTQYIQGVDTAVISSLTKTEMRSLFARRRRMCDIDVETESVLFAAFLDDIANGYVQLYPVEDERFDEAINLISLYPGHALRTLDALHLAVLRHIGINSLVTADSVIASVAVDMAIRVQKF